MKISARNILKGRVEAVTTGRVSAIVDLILDGGQPISASITAVSAESLELHKGKAAFAIIKASEVMIGVGVENAQISARNLLNGTVSKIVEGAVNDEVTLDLGGGTEVVATVTKRSVDALALKPDAPASAIIKASNVMIGV